MLIQIICICKKLPFIHHRQDLICTPKIQEHESMMFFFITSSLTLYAYFIKYILKSMSIYHERELYT